MQDVDSCKEIAIHNSCHVHGNLTCCILFTTEEHQHEYSPTTVSDEATEEATSAETKNTVVENAVFIVAIVFIGGN